GRHSARALAAASTWCDRANAALAYDLAFICFNGPEDELTKTENAQPGIFLVSWVAFQLLKERVPSLTFEATAGLSLGEFTALTGGGAVRFGESLPMAAHRGRFVYRECEAPRGRVAAVDAARSA